MKLSMKQKNINCEEFKKIRIVTITICKWYDGKQQYICYWFIFCDNSDYVQNYTCMISRSFTKRPHYVNISQRKTE